jgi:hypothetical protein
MRKAGVKIIFIYPILQIPDPQRPDFVVRILWLLLKLLLGLLLHHPLLLLLVHGSLIV